MRFDHIFEVTFAAYVAVTAIGTLLQVAVLIAREDDVVDLYHLTCRHVERCKKN